MSVTTETISPEANATLKRFDSFTEKAEKKIVDSGVEAYSPVYYLKRSSTFYAQLLSEMSSLDFWKAEAARRQDEIARLNERIGELEYNLSKAKNSETFHCLNGGLGKAHKTV